MENKKLEWCFGIKGGLRFIQSNERLSKSYFKEAKISLERAEKNFRDKDLLWTTVVIYYAEYYALYSFLQKIGVKCENHFCSILTIRHLLGENKIKIINQHKNKRVDAQYYMKIGKEEEIKQMLQEAKIFIADFDNLISNLDEDKINFYKEQLKKEEKKIKRLKDLEWMDQVLSKSKLTEKDAEEIGNKIKKEIAKRFRLTK